MFLPLKGTTIPQHSIFQMSVIMIFKAYSLVLSSG